MYCHECGNKLSDDALFCTNCGVKIHVDVKNTQNTESLTLKKVENVVSEEISNDEMLVTKRYRKIGLIWIVSPVLGLVGILTLYAISSFILTSLLAGDATTVNYASSDEDLRVLIVNLINVIMGLLGTVAVICIPIGVILGLIYFNKANRSLQNIKIYDERSGKAFLSTIPVEIKGWSWGAAGLTWIWGMNFNVWISLLAFVPFVNLIWWIVMGIKGNEWAWKANKWRSVDEFKTSQKNWNSCGLAIFVIGILLMVFSVIADN